MPADHSYRNPPATSTKTAAVSDDTEKAASPNNKVYSANVAAGGGNAFAATMATPKAEDEPGGPGFFDKMGALMGSSHLKKMVGAQSKGVTWDDSEKGANRMSVDVWGKDEMRVPKVRISELQREGLSASDVRADDIKLKEQAKSKSGAYVAELTATSAGASDLKMASPELAAAGIDLNGIKVRREMPNAKEGLSDFFSQPGTTKIEVGSAAVKGFSGLGVGAASLDAKGLGADVGESTDFGIASAQATDVSASGVNLATANVSGLKGNTGPNGLQVGMAGLDATGVKAGGTTADAAKVKDLAFQQANGASGVDVGSIDATNFAAGGATVGNAHVDKLGWRGGADGHSVTMDGIQGQNLKAGGLSVADARVSGAKVGVGAGGVDLAANAVAGSGITAGDLTMQTASATDAKGHVGGGKPTTGSAAMLGATGIKGKGGGAAGFEVDRGSATNVALATDAAGTTVDASAADVSGVRIADKATMGGAMIKDASATVNGAGVSARAKGFEATQLAAGPVSVAQATGTDGTLKTTPTGVDIGAAGIHARGIGAGDSKLEDASVQGLALQAGREKVSGTAKSGRISGLSGPASLKSADVTGASLDVGGGTTELGADTVSVDDLAVGGARVDAGQAKDAKFRTSASGTSTSIGSGKVTGVSAGDLTVQGGTLAGANVTTGEKGVSGSLKKGTASGIRAGDARIGEANVGGATFTSADGKTKANAATLGAKSIKAGGVTVDEASAAGVASVTGGGKNSATAERVSAKGVAAGDMKVGGVDATKARLSTEAVKGGTVTKAGAESIGASNVSSGAFTAGGVSATGVDATVTSGAKGKEVVAGAKGGSATKVGWQGGGTTVTADAVSTGKVGVTSGAGGTQINSEGLGAQNVKTTTAPSTAKKTDGAGGAGSSGMVQQVAGLVDDASVKAQIPLRGGTTGEGTKKVKVASGTTAFVEVRIVDGCIVPAGTGARFSQPLDTWGWTSVPGVYLASDGKLMAQVDGLLRDKDLSDKVNSALGVRGDSVPRNVKQLAAVAGAKGGGGQGGSGGGMADMSKANVQASVGLNPGTIKTDGVSATLGQGNRANVDMKGDKQLSVSFSKLILDAFGISGDGAQVDVKSVRADNAGVTTSPGGTAGAVGNLSTGAASVKLK